VRAAIKNTKTGVQNPQAEEGKERESCLSSSLPAVYDEALIKRKREEI
jgi:hypothetical protein